MEFFGRMPSFKAILEEQVAEARKRLTDLSSEVLVLEQALDVGEASPQDMEVIEKNAALVAQKAIKVEESVRFVLYGWRTVLKKREREKQRRQGVREEDSCSSSSSNLAD